MELFDEKEKVKNKLQQIQAEKNYYLGEFKENVILAVKKEELDGIPSEEIMSLMRREDAVLLKIRRDVPLKKVKMYIEEAEKIGLKYRLIDGLSLYGDIGLVIVSKETFDNAKKDVVLESKSQIYEDFGLSPLYAKCVGKKICKKHYEMLKERIPLYADKFEVLEFFDKLIGNKCLICEEEQKEGNNE